MKTIVYYEYHLQYFSVRDNAWRTLERYDTYEDAERAQDRHGVLHTRILPVAITIS